MTMTRFYASVRAGAAVQRTCVRVPRACTRACICVTVRCACLLLLVCDRSSVILFFGDRQIGRSRRTTFDLWCVLAGSSSVAAVGDDAPAATWRPTPGPSATRGGSEHRTRNPDKTARKGNPSLSSPAVLPPIPRLFPSFAYFLWIQSAYGFSRSEIFPR